MGLMEVSQKIRLIRASLQISWDELASCLQVPVSAIQAIEEGQQELSTEVLRRLVNELNISADWLLFDVGDMFISLPPRVKVNKIEIVPAGKYTGLEKILDSRIRNLEERLRKETHLPLEQIRVLFTTRLNLPVEGFAASGLPLELSLNNWHDLSWEGKTRYYQELKNKIKEGQQEFSDHFQRLVQLVCRRDF